MNAKCRPPGAKARKGVTYSDALAIQLLHFLDHAGYQLKKMVFDGKGHLVTIPDTVEGELPAKVETGTDVEARVTIFASELPRLADRYGAFEVARWFLLGREESSAKQSMRSAMNAKCRPPGSKARKGVTYADALAIQLLVFLDRNGYDLGGMRFDGQGWLLDIQKRPIG